jgi:DNA transformation protein
LRRPDFRAHHARHALLQGRRRQSPGYEAEGLEPFTYEARGKKVRIGAYWQVPERLFDDPDEMLDWARGALAAARRAPARKKPKAKNKRASG